jgi:hypothetical protein
MANCQIDCVNKCAQFAGHAGTTATAMPKPPPQRPTTVQATTTGWTGKPSDEDDSNLPPAQHPVHSTPACPLGTSCPTPWPTTFSKPPAHSWGNVPLTECPANVTQDGHTPPCYTRPPKPPPVHSKPPPPHHPPCDSCSPWDTGCKEICTVTEHHTRWETQHHTYHDTATLTKTSLCTETATTTRDRWNTCTETEFCTVTDIQKQTRTETNWATCTETLYCTETATTNLHHTYWKDRHHTYWTTCTEQQTQLSTRTKHHTETTTCTEHAVHTKSAWHSCYIPGKNNMTCTVTAMSNSTATATVYQPCWVKCNGRPDCYQSCIDSRPKPPAAKCHGPESCGCNHAAPTDYPVDAGYPYGPGNGPLQNDGYWSPPPTSAATSAASAKTTDDSDPYYNPYWKKNATETAKQKRSIDEARERMNQLRSDITYRSDQIRKYRNCTSYCVERDRSCFNECANDRCQDVCGSAQPRRDSYVDSCWSSCKPFYQPPPPPPPPTTLTPQPWPLQKQNPGGCHAGGECNKCGFGSYPPAASNWWGSEPCSNRRDQNNQLSAESPSADSPSHQQHQHQQQQQQQQQQVSQRDYYQPDHGDTASGHGQWIPKEDTLNPQGQPLRQSHNTTSGRWDRRN